MSDGIFSPLGQTQLVIGQTTFEHEHNPREKPGWENKEGTDVPCPVGTPLYAVSDGTIGDRLGPLHPGADGNERYAGNRVHLEMANGNEAYYAHLSRLADGLHAGQHVVAGQLLGYSGEAGGVAHLHIAFHHGNGTDMLRHATHFDPSAIEANHAGSAAASTGEPDYGAVVSGLPDGHRFDNDSIPLTIEPFQDLGFNITQGNNGDFGVSPFAISDLKILDETAPFNGDFGVFNNDPSIDSYTPTFDSIVPDSFNVPELAGWCGTGAFDDIGAASMPDLGVADVGLPMDAGFIAISDAGVGFDGSSAIGADGNVFIPGDAGGSF